MKPMAISRDWFFFMRETCVDGHPADVEHGDEKQRPILSADVLTVQERRALR
jgi:hypothetical protein